jgi:hypothetical protein
VAPIAPSGGRAAALLQDHPDRGGKDTDFGQCAGSPDSEHSNIKKFGLFDNSKIL